MRAVLAALMLCAAATAAHARDTGQYAGEPAAVRGWYRHAMLTPAAQKRFGFAGCCEQADVVKAKFRYERHAGSDAAPSWYYRNAETGAWRRIPDDIIHWDESAPDNQPTLFALSFPFGGAPAGALTCFYPPSGGY